MSSQEESKFIRLAKSVVDYHKEIKAQEYTMLDQFSNDVRIIEKMFQENDIPTFTYSWRINPDEPMCIMWDSPRFVFIWEGEPTPLLGETASVRLACREKFEEILEHGRLTAN